MRKLVPMLAGLLVVSAAHAQNATTTTDFKWNAEMRLRYFSNDNPLLTTVKGQENNWQHRNKIGVTATQGENFMGHFSLLNNIQWGNTGTTGQPAVNNTNDEFLVSEAYGWWKINENIATKFGRMGVTVADGSVISTNDDALVGGTPFTFDGAGFIFDYDFGRISALGVKGRDAQANRTPATGTPAAPLNPSADPETAFYGVSLDLKNLPDVLKMVNVHIIQENVDIPAGATATSFGANYLRYGITVGGEAANADFGLTYAGIGGKNRSATDTDRTGSMIHAKAGYKLPDVFGLHFGLAYHMDTGDDSATADKTERYQPFYYDRASFGGMMEVIGWGNLTYIQGDISAMPNEKTTVGAKYTMFSRTTEKDAAYGVNTASEASTPFTNTAAGTNTEKTLGSELDIYANHAYTNNFSIGAFYGMFTPGDAIKKTATGTDDIANFNEFMLQGKLTF